MQCPACQKELSPLTVENVTVQLCSDGCKGVWFDHFQLKKAEDPNLPLGQAIVDAEKRGPRVAVDETNAASAPPAESK